MGRPVRRFLRPALLAAALATLSAGPPGRFQVWRLGPEGVVTGPGDPPIAVGSLQKPFVAQAWAAEHPAQAAPRLSCPPGPGCWNRSGHGELGLVQALALSCNAYFRHLAADTSRDRLAAVFAEAGFVGVPRSPDAAIGLVADDAAPVIRPSDLLRAYTALARTPWTSGNQLRLEVLEGLREAARSGTAGGLGGRSGWAKTGTVPLDPLRTCGLALVVDAAGSASLGRLEPGTGREAATRLGRAGQDGSPSPGPEGARVTVRLLALLSGRRVWVANSGLGPVPSSTGFLGAGAQAELAAGQWVGPGVLEVREPRSGLVRRVRGRIDCRALPGGGRRLVLACTQQDYVRGVLAAELSGPTDSRRTELGAAVLRFLARGPRHPDADLCDSTHCAWFVGLDRAPRWPEADRFQPAPAEAVPPALDAVEWDGMVARARLPGPDQWTSHCGGRPLSPHALWGGKDHAAPPCPRHHGGGSRPWRRIWSRSAVERAFGLPVERMRVGDVDGTWALRVEGPSGTRSFDYDTAHRRLAGVLGWGALPSPADTVEADADGFVARGVGLGHRVGLCLGD